MSNDSVQRIAMVLAMDRNRLIGKDGGLPWHLPSELQYFKAITMGKPLVMGRLTFESIGRPLPGRANIVVTRDTAWLTPEGNKDSKDWAALGVLAADSLQGALKLADTAAKDKVSAEQDNTDTEVKDTEVAIIGGASLCRDAMPLTDRLYLTVIDHEFEGDTWFDSFDASKWRELSCETKKVDGFDLEYKVLERKPA